MLELLRERRGHLLRSTDEDPQRLEIIRLTAAQIRAQKRRCRQEDRAPIRLADFANLARLQRVGMIHDRRPDLERNPERDRVAETVEERQHAEQAIRRLRADSLNHRFRVRDDVAVRQHDPLGIAGRAAGEDDGA